jgi:hypothetical protein
MVCEEGAGFGEGHRFGERDVVSRVYPDEGLAEERKIKLKAQLALRIQTAVSNFLVFNA